MPFNMPSGHVVLPREMSSDDRKSLKRMGAKFSSIPTHMSDKLIYVKLPDGWSIREVPCSDIDKLMDDQSRVRGIISYVVDFRWGGDRGKASFKLCPRFDVSTDDMQATASRRVVSYVTDCGVRVFASKPKSVPDCVGDVWWKAVGKSTYACEQWLKRRGFDDWTNPEMYWD